MRKKKKYPNYSLNYCFTRQEQVDQLVFWVQWVANKYRPAKGRGKQHRSEQRRVQRDQPCAAETSGTELLRKHSSCRRSPPGHATGHAGPGKQEKSSSLARHKDGMGSSHWELLLIAGPASAVRYYGAQASMREQILDLLENQNY